MLFTRIKRPVAGTVLVTFLALVLQPLSVLAQDRPQSAASRRAAESGEEKFSRTLNEIHEILKQVVPHAAMPHVVRSGKREEMELRAIGPSLRIELERDKPAPGVDVAAKVTQLRAKARALASLEQQVRAGFDETERHIKEKNLPAEILARHEEALRTHETRAAEFKALLAAVERTANAGGAPLQAALADLGAFMAKHPNQKTHTPTDPNKLPWRSPKPVTREPFTSPSQFRTSRLFGEPIRVAQAGSLSGISLPSTTLPATPVPSDTAPTEDAQITQPIRDLAANLNNNPVQIYNWVRNNIQFIPSYGSIQGSDMTLQTRRGNSFDTASLLIALLRAANIPARYVYGTIEVPADKVMNWVGGASVPQAAINLMGQGGIPVMGITQSGQVRWIRLEHVWVEAFVDYVPSRGAVNRTPETWVPLDASFKQYQFTAGMDLLTNVPFDFTALLAQAQEGITFNETEGWAQNVYQSLVLQSLATYESRLAGHVDAQKPDATIEDVLGKQTIAQEDRPILLGTLPYARVATGGKFQAIPDNLRWKFRYVMYASDFDRAMDSPFIVLERSTASLAGKKITLSYNPASAADLSTIRSFMPQPHADGSPIQLTEYPLSLPGYLIRLIPELRVDGQVVATGPAVTMGTEMIQGAAFFDPATQQWEAGDDNRPIAGEYIATALDLQGISPAQVSAIRDRLNAVKARVEQFEQDPGSPAPVQGLSKEDVAGDLLYSAVLAYFAAIDSVALLSASSLNVLTQRMPSFGNFGMSAQPRFFFGTPRTVSFPGVQIDIDRIFGADVAKDGDNASVVAFRRNIGAQYSAHEHLIPEKLITEPGSPTSPQGMSAVKAIAVAASQGQRIYTLGRHNQDAHAVALSQLAIDAAAKQEIAAALAVGREATVHQANISAFGYAGAGYVIVDPDTGAGAYKIAGGIKGGSGADDYWGRYLAFVNQYMITLDHPAYILSLLALPAYKSWFGFGQPFGTSPYTTIIRGISVWLLAHYGFRIPFAAILGRVLLPIVVFVGVYNFMILLQGFFYAIANNVHRTHPRRYLAVRDRGGVAAGLARQAGPDPSGDPQARGAAV